MGRPSNREQRRNELTAAFSRVLADHGYAGATIAAVATEAGVAPGLVHHHFRNKQELLESLFEELVNRFRHRVRERGSEGDVLEAYADAALRLDARSDITAARSWVGIFAEAVRDPSLFQKMRRMIDSEIVAIQRHSDGALSSQDAAAVLAFVVGALVMGAFAPTKTKGFAAPALRTFIRALRTKDGAPVR